MDAPVKEDLLAEESELIGMWLDLGSTVTGDAVYDRIEWLVAERLQLLAGEPDALVRLYRHPEDGRLWEYERTFPGAPPRLHAVTAREAAERHGISP